MRWPWRRHTDAEWDAAHRWDRLATYNAECSRGLVHTPAWDMVMAWEQEQFDKEQRQRWEADPKVILMGTAPTSAPSSDEPEGQKP